jgi:hypothetical protein
VLAAILLMFAGDTPDHHQRERHGTVNGQFSSPDTTNCGAGTLSNAGTVYEHTFSQPDTYSYFCAMLLGRHDWRHYRCHRAATDPEATSESASQGPRRQGR